MNPYLAFALGLGLGLAVTKVLIQPSDCCKRVAAGVRDRVGSELGATAQSVGDVLGIWEYTPGLLEKLGVAP